MSVQARHIRPLREVLALVRDEVRVEPDGTYRLAGIYSFGKGLFEREQISGAETSYRTLFRLTEGQFVVSKLNGWEGAVDVVSSDHAGCVVSGEYPTFAVDRDQADPAYLRWIARWPKFWDLLVPRGSMVRRKRVAIAQLLDVSIPLPPLEEQRGIAARLDDIAGIQARIRSRAAASQTLSDALTVSLSSRPELDDAAKGGLGWQKIKLGSALAVATDRHAVDAATSYPNLGIYSFGRGLFAKPDIDGDSTSATALYRVRAGQFIYSRLFAFEGAYAWVRPEFDGYFVSNEFPTFDPDPDQLDARWLATYLRSPDRWVELAGSSKGLGVRRQRVPVDAVLAYEIWLPPLEQQREMLRTIDDLAAGQQLRAKSAELAASLVPAILNETFGDHT